MDDLEARLRAAVRQRADELTPAPELTERIHARVAHRRRQRRIAAGALGTAAVALAAVGLAAVLAGTGDEDTVQVAGSSTTTTASEPAPPTTSTTEPPPSTDTAPTSETTGGPTTTGGAEPPPTSGEPPETQPDQTPSTTTTTSPPDLEPPDSDRPAAGVCGEASGAVVELVINPDVPSPRCARVTADQRLQVRNAAGQTVTVSFVGFSAELAPGATQADDRAFGDYLQPGVHRVTVSLYGDSGPEIWLAP